MRMDMLLMSSMKVKLSSQLRSSLPMLLPQLPHMHQPLLQLLHLPTGLLLLLLIGLPLLLTLDLTKVGPIIFAYICLIYLKLKINIEKSLVILPTCTFLHHLFHGILSQVKY
jgi:hypothetical protein